MRRIWLVLAAVLLCVEIGYGAEIEIPAEVTDAVPPEAAALLDGADGAAQEGTLWTMDQIRPAFSVRSCASALPSPCCARSSSASRSLIAPQDAARCACASAPLCPCPAQNALSGGR